LLGAKVMTRTNSDLGKLLLRITLGVCILLHGVAKLQGGVGGIAQGVTALGLPGFVAYGVYVGEIVGPLLLIIGWFARIGAALIAINMIFAIAIAHSADLFKLGEQGGWALELQGMYLMTAIALALMGPGRFSINQR
jgi:putative oxidoreductase